MTDPHATSETRLKSVLDACATIAVLIAAAVVVWTQLVGPRNARAANTPRLDLPSEPISLRGTPVRGQASAKAALVAYSDFECPFCKRFVDTTLPTIERDYVSTGKVLIAFKHAPLPNHRLALRAAEASYCAGLQNQFWAAHDLLFRRLDDARLTALPTALALDVKRFDDCLEAPPAREAVQSDLDSASQLGVKGTPSFFIGALLPDNSVKISTAFTGAATIAEFRHALDPLVKVPR